MCDSKEGWVTSMTEPRVSASNPKRGFLRRGVVATVLVAGAIVLGGGPAHAIPPAPGHPDEGGDFLTVLTFHDGLGGPAIGQTWFGCPGVPQQSWGTTTGITTIDFLSCVDTGDPGIPDWDDEIPFPLPPPPDPELPPGGPPGCTLCEEP
jgi:hypothetical protein